MSFYLTISKRPFVVRRYNKILFLLTRAEKMAKSCLGNVVIVNLTISNKRL